MRGIGHTLSRLPQVRALLAGAAILAGTFVTAAHGQSSGSGNGTGTPDTDGTRAEEAALVMPHIQHGGSAVMLPKPLTPSDAAVLREVFALQSRNKIPEAIRAANDITNPLLNGAFLADRFLGPAYRSSPEDLMAWLALHRDEPDAPQIYALLLTKLPKGATPPAAPDVPSLSPLTHAAPVSNETVPDGDSTLMPVTSYRGVIDMARTGRLTQALRQVKAARLQPGIAARLHAEIARTLFATNRDEDALRLVQDSLEHTPQADQNSLTWYIGGLAAWRLERYEVALELFQGGSEAAITTPALRAACAFWASRAWRTQYNSRETIRWLNRAAEDRTTFHGLIARRLLRMDIGLVPSRDLLTQADVDAVATTGAGLRAFALVQIDQLDRAEAELRTLWPEIQQNPVFGRSVLLVASAAGLQDFAAQLAGLLQPPGSGGFDALRYPIPQLRPARGFRLDPALVYALARTESNFDPSAVSSAGARGLMQLTPSTAAYIAGGMASERLGEPAVNLDLGQRYVNYLAALDGVGGNLIRVLASYNSGPGNFQRWASDIHDNDDPLLFIEAIPVAETREFVANVLRASWIYAARMHRPIPSLDSLAAGEFPELNPHTGAPIEMSAISARVH